MFQRMKKPQNSLSVFPSIGTAGLHLEWLILASGRTNPGENID